jgi:ribosomal protein L12E/L44/L45/RPP1/RPP2
MSICRFRPAYRPLLTGFSESSIFQLIGNAILMGKKKASSAQASKAAAKAAKKAKAAQKIERKEKKKSGKAKDEFEDDQDLEAILENVTYQNRSAFASRGFV